MSEPFVFHFQLDSRGFPNLMTVADVQGVCGLCGHDEIQRFYRALPFHTMTVERLLDWADDVPGWADYECANCGSPVGPEHVQESALVWGFADDAGLVRVFGTGDDARVQLVAGRRLDPQELPGFAPPAEQGPEVDVLDEATVEDVLERPFNLKLAVREFVREIVADPEPSWAPLGPNMCVRYAMSADQIDDEVDYDSPVDLSIDDLVPRGLATLEQLPDPAAIPGRIETWLGPELLGAATSLGVEFTVDTSPIRDAMARAFSVARLDFEATDQAVCRITTPTEHPYPHDLDYRSIARRACYTGISPGESARLTAEEVVAPLLNVNRRK
jgi:hypothetical protein